MMFLVPGLALFLITFIAFRAPSLDKRIIGGTPAEINTVPYQVSLQNNDGHFCGGSIIHKSYILTAAHCLDDEPVRGIKIRAGSKFLYRGGTIRGVCGVHKHPRYKNCDENCDYDVAVLKLCSDLIFNQNVSAVALPQFREVVKDGTSVSVTGWGITKETDLNLSPLLQKASLVTVKQRICRRIIKTGIISNRMLCAGCKVGLCDACLGDSGGPLVVDNKVVGIVSWGERCAWEGYPGVYTQVSKFTKWIKSKTN